MKHSALFIILSIFSFDSFSQEKVFQITDDGKYFFLDKEYLNSSSISEEKFTSLYRPITLRTFYLEAKRMGVFPMNVNYPQFAYMTIPEQQNFLNNLQGEVKRTIAPIEDLQAADPVKVKEKSEKSIVSKEPYFDNISIRQIGYDKENQIIVGELVSDSGVLQQFLIYSSERVRSGNSNANWVIEMLEPELIQKKKGYGNLKIDYEAVYQLLSNQGVNDQFLQDLSASR